MKNPKKYFCIDCGEATNGSRCRPCSARRLPRPGPLGGVARALELAVLYRGGCTLQEIGDAIGLSRERVRQLIATVEPRTRPVGWRQENLGELSPMARRKLGIASGITKTYRFRRLWIFPISDSRYSSP